VNQAARVKRLRFSLSGQVQGVGFRPFVFRLAGRYGLGGEVFNTGRGVIIEVQGRPDSLAAFRLALREELPPLARLSGWQEESLPVRRGEDGFQILASSYGPGNAGQADEVLLTSPDVAVCEACLREALDPADRRYGYAFTNCTDCGPRYSIIANLPYDRPGTSMACFPMCPACAAEYANPADRRFHAQPNACPDCGPRLWFTEARAPGPDSRPENCAGGARAMELAARGLRQGKILAIKGLGGFHLACDATSAAAVARLRKHKERPHKPLALMAADLEQASRLARLDKRAIALLNAPERPIVLCPPLPGQGPLAPNIAPDTARLGLMLPCTPLHHLLLRTVERPLVMTSGNHGGEPIALGNREAMLRLRGLADAFLLHDRDILTRLDDSVLLPLPEFGAETAAETGDCGYIMLRRARGFVPCPIGLPDLAAPTPPAGASALALGADLKNTVCLTRGNQAFVSQHIGDLQNLATAAFQAESAAHLARLLQVRPDRLVTDSHPAFAASLYGGLSAMPEGWAELPKLTLQHHYAHAEAVLAENPDDEALREDRRALVLALDGTGYALDEDGQAALWGGELLLVDYAAAREGGKEHRRLGSLTPLDLPGGEAAIREPWRIAQALLCRLNIHNGRANRGVLPWLPRFAETAALIPQMLEKGLNSPRSSGCGRVFDAASALLGLCLEITYEGQAAIRLETAQAGASIEPPPALACPLLRGGKAAPPLVLDTRSLLRGVHEARQAGAGLPALARSFHQALANGLAELALAGAKLAGCRCVGLSGGVMQNLTLFSLLKTELRRRGLRPLAHRQLPPNDACISYGQAAWATRLSQRSG
jgi:hydrogenase maturation protein HypF